MTKIFTLSNEWYLFGVSTGSSLYSQLLLNKESDIDFSCVVVSLGSRTNTISSESIQTYSLSQYLENSNYSSYIYKADVSSSYYKKDDWAYLTDWSNTTIDISFSFGAWVLTKYLDPSVKYIPVTNLDLFTYIISDIPSRDISLINFTDLSPLNAIYQVSSDSVKQKYENSSTWVNLLNTSHNITSISKLFYNCSNFNQDISNWNTSNIENMEGLFENATSFYQDISSWDFSNCLNSDILSNYLKIFYNSGISNSAWFPSPWGIQYNVYNAFRLSYSVKLQNHLINTITKTKNKYGILFITGLNILIKTNHYTNYLFYNDKQLWYLVKMFPLNTYFKPGISDFFSSITGLGDYDNLHKLMRDYIYEYIDYSYTSSIQFSYVTAFLNSGAYMINQCRSASGGGYRTSMINSYISDLGSGNIKINYLFNEYYSFVFNMINILKSDHTVNEIFINIYSTIYLFNIDYGSIGNNKRYDAYITLENFIENNTYYFINSTDNSFKDTYDDCSFILIYDISNSYDINYISFYYSKSEVSAFGIDNENDFIIYIKGLISQSYNSGPISTNINSMYDNSHIIITLKASHYNELSISELRAAEEAAAEATALAIQTETLEDVMRAINNNKKIVLTGSLAQNLWINLRELNVSKENFNNYQYWSNRDILGNTTDLSGMFYDATDFNADISNWDVSNVTNMSYMFSGATNFSRDLSWNVSNVSNMSYMFYGANNFNGNISNWDVSSVTNMSYMFSNANIFNRDISNWNVHNVNNMEGMFSGAHSFNPNFLNWKVDKVTNMSYMFNNAFDFDLNASHDLYWNVSNVTNMSYMFSGATNFNLDISNWTVSNVTNMEGMFYDVTNFNRDISSWNVSKVTNMSYMFYKATNFNENISNWNVSKVTNMSYMFYHATKFNADISKWDVSKVTNMSSMFYHATDFNADISSWNVSKVTNMEYMFNSAISFNRDISNWANYFVSTNTIGTSGRPYIISMFASSGLVDTINLHHIKTSWSTTINAPYTEDEFSHALTIY